MLQRFCFAVLLVSFVWAGQAAGDTELLQIRTRFGPVDVVRVDEAEVCCMGYIRFRSQKIEAPSTGTIYAHLVGLYRVREGDIVVLRVPSGVKGMPPDPYVILVNQRGIFDLTDHQRMEPGEDTFRVAQKGNEIHFDLGFENRLRKKAVYRNGVLYVGVDRFRIEETLPKSACTDVLRRLTKCERRSDCSAEGALNDESMSQMRAFNTFERMPVFDRENYYKACARVCAQKARPVEERKILCGY